MTMTPEHLSTGESSTAAAAEAPAVNLERKARKEAQKALKAQQAAEKKAAKHAQAASQPQPASSSKPKPKPRQDGRRAQSSSEQLSRALAYILRHGADKEGLSIRPDGYIALDQVLDRPRVKSVNMCDEPGQKRRPALQDIQHIVDTNDKKRFELLHDDHAGWLIRAVQGHSLTHVVELEHTPLTLTNLHLLALDPIDDADALADDIDSKLGLDQETKVEVVHGTFADAWDKIVASGGLKRMSRNHIHLAKGRFGQKGVVSGMRKSANRLIFVDVRRAIADGFEFALSSNGVVLTPGKGDEGVLPIEYFTRVEDAKGNVVWTPSAQPA